MTCDWNALLGILPPRLREETNRYGSSLQEIRLRMEKPIELICNGGKSYLQDRPTQSDMNFIINAACRYSPWTASGAAYGYISAPGGHRIGLCGEAVVQEQKMTGLRSVRSLNIRIARDYPGIGKSLCSLKGSILIIGSPGNGKTTLLRDLLRQLSYQETVSVVDERGELFPPGFDTGQALDILQFCPKAQGLDAVIRTMSPKTVGIDEITAEADCNALYCAGWSGVRLIATAHASSVQDLMKRPVYKPLADNKLFSYFVTLDNSKHFVVERTGL